MKRTSGDILKVGSVASIFVSRIDVAIDKRLDKLGDKRLAGPTARQRGNRQRETRLRSLQSAVLRTALAKSGRGGCEDTTSALGIHQHEKPRLQ